MALDPLLVEGWAAGCSWEEICAIAAGCAFGCGEPCLGKVLSCQTFAPIEICGSIDLAVHLSLVEASAVGREW